MPCVYVQTPLVFEEEVDPSHRSFLSEIVSSVSDVKFSHSGRYLLTRDYLTVKVWDLNMENKPVETYQVSHLLTHSHIYTNSQCFSEKICKLLSAYEAGLASLTQNKKMYHCSTVFIVHPQWWYHGVTSGS